MASDTEDFDPCDDAYILESYEQFTAATLPESVTTFPAPSSSSSSSTITNADIIDQYVKRTSWRRAAEWLSHKTSTPVQSEKAIRTDWTRLHNDFSKLRHPKYSSQKQTFLCRPYKVPKSIVPPTTLNNAACLANVPSTPQDAACMTPVSTSLQNVVEVATSTVGTAVQTLKMIVHWSLQTRMKTFPYVYILMSFTDEDSVPLQNILRQDKRDSLINRLKDKVNTEHTKHQ